MKLEQNISIFDVVATKNGNINNIIQFIVDNGLSTINDNLSGIEINPYSNNEFSQQLKFSNKLAATRDLNIPTFTFGDFNNNFNDDFNTL